LRPEVLSCDHHLLERGYAGDAGGGVLALLVGTVARDFAGAGLVLDHGETVAGFRRAVEASTSTERTVRPRRWSLALIVDKCAHAAHLGAGDDDVADLQCAALNQTVATGPRPRSSCFDHGAFGGTRDVGLEVEQFGLQRGSFPAACRGWSCSWRRLDIDHVGRPIDSTCTSYCKQARCARAPACGLSILLMAMIIGTFAALA